MGSKRGYYLNQKANEEALIEAMRERAALEFLVELETLSKNRRYAWEFSDDDDEEEIGFGSYD